MINLMFLTPDFSESYVASKKI